MDITTTAELDMADLLDELTYRLIANVTSRSDACDRVTIIGYWADQQTARLTTGRALRVDHEAVVAEALALTGHSAPPADQPAA